MEINIDIIDSIKWPIVVVVVFLLFRKSISAFLKRMNTFKAVGVKMTAAQPTTSAESTATSIKELEKSDIPTVQSTFEQIIEKELKSRNMDINLESSKFLIKVLAATQIRLYFETVDKTIYGSQISILYRLNSLPKGESKNNLKNFYDEAVKEWSDVYSQYSYDNYFEYLSNMSLIFKKDEKYFITDLGREFLSYIARSGYTGKRFY